VRRGRPGGHRARRPLRQSAQPIGARDNHPGEVSGFGPPGDIHRIRNTGTRTAISLHIYGTDITRIGSSARRYYS
jgi:3-mercaptopropionate dioxygenase